MIFVLGGSGSWVGAIIFFGLLLLIGGFIAMMAVMCAVGPFLALHEWAIGKPGYQKFASHIPGYLEWIEKRRQEQRKEHAEWKRAYDEEFGWYERMGYDPDVLAEKIRRWKQKHPEPHDPDRNSRGKDGC